MNKFTIFNIFGSSNVGDGALITSMIKLLKQKGISESSINLVCLDPVSESSFQDSRHKFFHRIVNRRDFANIFHFSLSLALGYLYGFTGYFKSLFYLSLPKSQQKSLNALDTTSLAVSCPGGYLEDSNKSYIINILQILLSTRLSARTILAPQSIGPIKSKVSIILLEYALRRVDKIFVRETYSFDFVRNTFSSCVNNKTFLSGDLALSIDHISKKALPISSQDHSFTWGLTIVDWYFPNSKNASLLRRDYLKSVISISEYIYNLTGQRGVIMNQVDADKNLAISLSNQCAYLDFDPTIYSYSEMIDIISKYHFFLGTRFHSCIFSMLSATPFVSINYLPKSRGILNQLKLSELSVDINQCDRDLFPAVKKVLSNLTNTSNVIQSSLLTYESDFIAPFVSSLDEYLL